MNRRDFIKTGALAFALTQGGVSFAFVPDEMYASELVNNYLPFRKQSRGIKEVVPGFLWADAADFETYGGWALDTQHVGFMGSSYLIAHGTRAPVADASLRLRGVRAGRYRVWVRSRNWIPEHAPGRFRLDINDTDSGKVYGAQQERGWTWQDGGVHELAGDVGLTLRDETGLYGRCSSILLSTDLDYQPPVAVDAFLTERRRLAGVSDRIRTETEYDVVIVGAGSAGCCAALAAARMGAKTALLSDRPVLGGNCSVEIGVPIQGAAGKHTHEPVRETGIVEEAGRLGLAKGWGKTMSRPFAALIEAEPNITLFENFWLEGVKMEGSRIREALCRDTLTGERTSFPGKMFIDTSGDGWLGYHAGADFRVGREAQDEHDEENAPEQTDDMTMSGCLRGPQPGYKGCIFLRTKRHLFPQPFETPGWLYEMPEGCLNDRGGEAYVMHSAKSGSWWFEHPCDVDDLWDPEFARDELIRVNFTMFNYFKNVWSRRDELRDYSLEYVPFMVGKRESRRMLGDYILDQDDCVSGRLFDDGIGHYGWTLDIHAIKGIQSTTGFYDMDIPVPIGHIPYRCLYSRNVENLFMAGRNISVTHIALGTVRVQGQTALTGQAVGTAAAFALANGTTPRGVYEKHMSTLQQLLLKADQYIPGVRNEDEEDLAREAAVRASSERLPADAQSEFQGRWLALDHRRGEFFPWTAGDVLKVPQLFLQSEADCEVTLHVREARSPDDLSATEDVATVTRSLSALSEEWVHFPVKTVISSPFVWIFLDVKKPVRWFSGAPHSPGSHRLYAAAVGPWTSVKSGGMAIRLDSEPGAKLTFEAGKVINGVARPTEGDANCWESATSEDLPQWLELTLKQPARVGAIHCVFDTDLRGPLAALSDAFPETCVRDYTLACFVEGAWQTVARVRDNFHRFRRHTFPSVKTDRVRLTAEATHGAKTARVFEMRVYAG